MLVFEGIYIDNFPPSGLYPVKSSSPPREWKRLSLARGSGLTTTLYTFFTYPHLPPTLLILQDYESKRSRDRKQFEAWLATQPYDDE